MQKRGNLKGEPSFIIFRNKISTHPLVNRNRKDTKRGFSTWRINSQPAWNFRNCSCEQAQFHTLFLSSSIAKKTNSTGNSSFRLVPHGNPLQYSCLENPVQLATLGFLFSSNLTEHLFLFMSHLNHHATAAKSLQSCLTLCDPFARQASLSITNSQIHSNSCPSSR